MPVAVQLEQLRAGPGVGRVKGHIDRDVPDDADAPGVGVGFQAVPLPVKLILDKPLEVQLPGQLFPGLCQRVGLTQPEIIRPQVPGGAALCRLDGGEQGIVLQPGALRLTKARYVPLLLPPAACQRAKALRSSDSRSRYSLP